jgi:transcriptional regulator with XRE-family HTH domain
MCTGKEEQSLDKQRVGQMLRTLRGEKSLEAVAAACGITRQAVCNYETGERVPKDDIKVKLANYYGVSVQSIFFPD